MEDREGINQSMFTLKRHEAPESFLMDPRPENPNPFPASTSTPATTTAACGETPAPPPFSLTMQADGTASDAKKRRGRPRKYNPDGTLAVTLSPMPISSSVPFTGGLSGRKRGRGRGKSVDALKKSQQFQLERPGGGIPSFVGANFVPHVLTVNAGEDVTMKIMSFSHEGSRAICVLSANGAVSNVTLRQPMSSGGTVTYEGRFEILSLSGSFTPSESGGTRSRSGGMSVSLAGPDGRVFGGGLAGLFIAVGPVQVMLGSFLVGHEHERKHEKQRVTAPSSLAPTVVHTITAEELRAGYEKVNPVNQPPASFLQQNQAFANTNSVQDYYTNSADDDSKESLSSLGEEEESDGDGLSESELPN